MEETTLLSMSGFKKIKLMSLTIPAYSMKLAVMTAMRVSVNMATGNVQR